MQDKRETQGTGEELRGMIVDELVRQRSRDDIIQAVCERGGLKWPQAEQLVQQVELEQAHAVARGQSPFLIFLSVVTAAGGLLLLNYSIQIVEESFHGSMLQQLLSLGTADYPIAIGFIGLSMIGGGVIGMWKTLLRYFET